MDEIFGPENFLANITWEKTQTPEDTKSPFLEAHTHVIAYARNAEFWPPNPSAGKVPTIWSATEVGAHELQTVAPSHPAAPYPLIRKPVGLLRRILRIAAGPDALVLDPFAGSGTTAQAVLEQNGSDGGHRKFVLIEADDRAHTLISRRLAEMPGVPPDYDFFTLAPDRAGTLDGEGPRIVSLTTHRVRRLAIMLACYAGAQTSRIRNFGGSGKRSSMSAGSLRKPEKRRRRRPRGSASYASG
jgi:hypothetical protein